MRSSVCVDKFKTINVTCGANFEGGGVAKVMHLPGRYILQQ